MVSTASVWACNRCVCDTGCSRMRLLTWLWFYERFCNIWLYISVLRLSDNPEWGSMFLHMCFLMAYPITDTGVFSWTKVALHNKCWVPFMPPGVFNKWFQGMPCCWTELADVLNLKQKDMRIKALVKLMGGVVGVCILCHWIGVYKSAHTYIQWCNSEHLLGTLQQRPFTRQGCTII